MVKLPRIGGAPPVARYVNVVVLGVAFNTYVPPTPILPVPGVAKIVAPLYNPVVEVTVTVTIQGPEPDILVIVPVLLISLPTVVQLFAFQLMLVPAQPSKISPPLGFVTVIA